MICPHPVHPYPRAVEERAVRPEAPGAVRRDDSLRDASMPLLDAIAAGLRLAGEVDERASFRTARRLLEAAFRAVDHAAVVSDPQPIMGATP